jgi:hypothetical protein
MAKIAVAGIFAFGLAVIAGAAWARFHPAPEPSPGPTAAAQPTAPAAPADLVAPPDAPTATASPPGAAAAWRGIVSYLESTRIEAFATGRPALLNTVYAVGTPGLAVDVASVRSLAQRGLHAAGLTATVVRVKVEANTDRAVTLRVVDRLSSYRLVNASGTTVSLGAGRAARAFTMRLVRTPSGWRIASIVP